MMVAANTIISIIAISGIALIFYGPWQGLCVDYARQVVFEQRDRLFDLAADGKLSFDSQDYRTVRKSLEALIRFAHDVTIWKMIYLAIVDKEEDKDVVTGADLMDIANNMEDEELKGEIIVIIEKSISVIVIMMMARSLLSICAICLIPIALCFALGVVGGSAASKLYRKVLGHVGQAIQTEADLFSASL